MLVILLRQMYSDFDIADVSGSIRMFSDVMKKVGDKTGWR